MKKILCITVVSLILTSDLSAEVLTSTSPGYSSWCLIGSPTAYNLDTSRNTCYWCESGGERPGGFCTSSYASCAGGSDRVVATGGTLTDDTNNVDWKCTKSGWVQYEEPESCNGVNGCKDGCYWVPQLYGCISCPVPDFDNALPGPISVHTGNNDLHYAITDCYVSSGTYADNTGEFRLIGNCRYSN